MFKKLIMTFTIFSIVSLSTVAFAAPDTVGVDEQGNASGLVVITNPDISKSSEVTTDKKNYIISGYGQEGVNACLYLYSPEENVYRKAIINGSNIEWEIGASGLFMQSVMLVKGENKILIRAVNDDGDKQIITLDVTLMNESFINKIKGLTINIFDELGIGK